MSINLVRTLIRITFAPTASKTVAIARKQLHCATQSQWESTLATLNLHRLTPLVSHALEQNGLLDLVPQDYRDRLQGAYQTTFAKNKIFLLTLDGILQRLQGQNLHPVIWKGIALADSFYPDPGTRPMGDLDFAIPAEEMEAASAVFESLGFQAQAQAETEDAVYFVNPMGVKCDVHHRVRLFEGKESENLTVDLKPQHLQVPSLPLLEANAMLVHLVVHMDGHLDETGPLLSWMLDVAWVLRKWGDRLDRDRLETLMPADEHWVSLLRVVRFLQREFDEPIPEALATAAQEVEPFTLDELLRQRRLALWGLPSLRGWLRLGASGLNSRLRQTRPTLRAKDLLLWVVDAWKRRRAMQVAGVR